MDKYLLDSHHSDDGGRRPPPKHSRRARWPLLGWWRKIDNECSNPQPSQQATHHHLEKKKLGSIQSNFQDLRNAKAPASPGEHLASFLNSLFTITGNSRKSKSTTTIATMATYSDGGMRGGEESMCSTITSYSRSCLSKMPSLKGQQPLVGGGC